MRRTTKLRAALPLVGGCIVAGSLMIFAPAPSVLAHPGHDHGGGSSSGSDSGSNGGGGRSGGSQDPYAPKCPGGLPRPAGSAGCPSGGS